jgi:RHS repeat-associated protein
VDSSGDRIADLRFKPWGSTRYAFGEQVTEYTFNGQRSKVESFGLIYFQARWFDPALGRFSQADTIIPGVGNPISWDRYAFVINNPLKYVDPTGNNYECGPDGIWCDDKPENDDDYPPLDYTPPPESPPPPPKDPSKSEMEDYIASFGITLQGDWSLSLLTNLWDALFTYIGYEELILWLQGSSITLISGGIGTCDIHKYSGWTDGKIITFYSNGATNPIINILHEFGHLVDNIWGDFFTNSLYNVEFTWGGIDFAGWDGKNYSSLPSDIVRSVGLISPNIGGGNAWQQKGGITHYEDWADIFSNAMIGNINPLSDLGSQMYNFAYKMINHAYGIDVNVLPWE